MFLYFIQMIIISLQRKSRMLFNKKHNFEHFIVDFLHYQRFFFFLMFAQLYIFSFKY